MSAQVVRNFFPVLLHRADSNPLISKIINTIFPPRIQLLCPVPLINLQGDFELRWPTVAAACIGGCLFNLLGGGHLLYRSTITNKKGFNGFFSWGFALLWYALMCLGGLMYHCILPSPLFRNIDVIGTACSSVSIIAGSILTDDTVPHTRIALLATYASVTMAAICGPQVVREILYLGPTVVAFAAAGWFVWRVNNEKGDKATSGDLRKWSMAAAVGAAVAVGSVACDQWLCVELGSNYSMLFWFFVGSDVAIFAFFPIALLLQRSRSRVKHV